MDLNEFERITLLMMRGYGDRVRSFEEVRNLFNENFPDRLPIAKSTVYKTVKRFEESGIVRNRPRSGRPKSVLTENTKLNVMLQITENPRSSIREVSRNFDINKSSVHQVLTENKLRPYKIQLHQELSEDDFDRRVEFSEIMMNKIVEQPNFLKNVVFSDEATFMLNGTVNRHNSRYWSEENPHWFQEVHTQHPEKMNVWAGIVSDTLIGPFIIEGNLTGEMYEGMLRNQIVPAIQNYFGENFINAWFQQDGAPAHFAIQVRALLNDIFPARWIGRRGQIEWPPRSPDLSPLDFFFWGYLKDKVYKTKPENLGELRRRILNEAGQIQGESICNAINAFYDRAAFCQQVGGCHFEHLL